jgi:uncharacterized protein
MKTFLTAEWRKLIMANYVVPPTLLAPFVPKNTELDFWNGNCYVSLIGFMFQNTKLKGIRIPFHSKFEEVNLRFYVKHKKDNEWKRGAVFIKEIVPKFMISLVANTLYGEHYQTLPMKNTFNTEGGIQSIEYSWKMDDWQSIKVEAETFLIPILEGSEAEFITEHYWGYTQLNSGKTSEYGVEHPRWDMYPVKKQRINVDFGKNYGAQFEFLNQEKPNSVFLAEGSEIVVREGRFI